MRSVPAISFEPTPSRQLLLATGGMVLLALVSLAISALPWWASLPAGAVVLALTAFAIQRYRRPRYTVISHDQTGWQLRDRAGDWIAVTLRHHGQLGSWVILDFTMPSWRWTILLSGDCIDADTRRRLLLVVAATSSESIGKPATGA